MVIVALVLSLCVRTEGKDLFIGSTDLSSGFVLSLVNSLTMFMVSCFTLTVPWLTTFFFFLSFSCTAPSTYALILILVS